MDTTTTLEEIIKRANSENDTDPMGFIIKLINGEYQSFNNAIEALQHPHERKQINETDVLNIMIEEIADYVSRGLRLLSAGAKANKICIYNASELETGDGPVAELISGDKVIRLSYIRLREIVESHEIGHNEASFCYFTAEGVWLEFCGYCKDANSALEEVCKKVSKAFGGVPCYLNGSEYTGSDI